MEHTNQIKLDEVREACISNFATFVQLMQDDGFFDPIHKQLCDWTQGHIEKMERKVEASGVCNGRLLYVMPRGSLKSTIVTKHLSTWLVVRRYYLFKDDSTRILLSGNTFTNAKKKLNGIRGTFEQVDLFRALFPELLPRLGRDGNIWREDAAEINRRSAFDEATFECAGMNTKLTGRHYNVLVEDDTTAPDADEMKQELTRPSLGTIEKSIGFHRASMPLFVPKGFRLSVIVSTRWAFSDLVSYVQKEEHYNYFDVPAERDGKPTFSFAYDAETLAIIKERVGPYMYSMLYLNKPLDDSMRVFKGADFNWVLPKEVPTTGSISIAVDPAISEKDEACDSAITVNQHVVTGDNERHEYWWETAKGFYLPLALCEKTLQLADKYDTEETPVTSIILETVAYQAALKYIMLDLMQARKKLGKRVYKIISHKTRSNKLVRIEGMQPAFSRGRIHFVSGRLDSTTEEQLLEFPNGRLVDVIDSWSMHRKVWRVERHEEPAPAAVEDLFDFDAAFEELTRRSAKRRSTAARGLGSGLTFVGQGLGGYSKRKGRNHVFA